MESRKDTAHEEYVLSLGLSWKSHFIFYVAILIFGIGPLINPKVGMSRISGVILSILLLLVVLVRQKITHYRLSPKDALREISFAGKSFKKSLPLEEIAGLEVHRGIMHRLLGIGHLWFRPKSKGRDLWWFGINDPFKVKNIIELYLSKNRRK
jgi:hypothetical protein